MSKNANPSSVLGAPLLRKLADRSYEARKSAAQGVEFIVKSIREEEAKNPPAKNEDGTTPPSSKILDVIETLATQFAFSTDVKRRQGGLIALAAIGIALQEDTKKYLGLLLPPMLKCVEDPESRVRYQACEALYNITKVARSDVLGWFNAIFDGLCKLYADVDTAVKQGAQLLDSLLKEVVTEGSRFDVDLFIPLLEERIKIKNPFIRQLLVSWIAALDSVPDIDMLEFLPEYLGGLLDILSDCTRQQWLIRKNAADTLQALLDEMTMSLNVDMGPMMPILVSRVGSKDSYTRLTVLAWICAFINIGEQKVLDYAADLLGAALNCIADSEFEIRKKAEETNTGLLAQVEKAASTEEGLDKKETVSSSSLLDIKSVVEVLTGSLQTDHIPSRHAALRWISMLLEKYPLQMFPYLKTVFPALLSTLQENDDRVVRLDLEVLARISIDKDGNLDQKNFEMVLNHVMSKFKEDRVFMESHASVIIRQLSRFIPGEDIYRTFASILAKETDLEFASLMVQTFNVILLTSGELFELRKVLKTCLTTTEGSDLFKCLYSCWTHNPVATFSLCLLVQAYELSSALVFELAELQVTVGFLMQIDKLVQLLESPIFMHLRLRLLESENYPFLFKSLYGLLMLLPQSKAFNRLQTRLSAVSSLATVKMPKSDVADMSTTKMQCIMLDFKKLLKQFHVTQKEHRAFREILIKEQGQDHNLGRPMSSPSPITESKQSASQDQSRSSSTLLE
jgi:vacuole morphology and inheritance protein 14